MSAPQPKTFVHSSALGSRFAIADFDGDQRPDLATVQTVGSIASATRYSIRFDLSTGSEQLISVIAPNGGLQIISQDVNGDSFLDLIVSTQWLNRPVAILLNDGRGNFAIVDPSAFPEVAWGSQNSWSIEAPQFKDTAVLNLSRFPPCACETLRGLALPLYLPDVLRYTNVGIHTLPLDLAPFGRAPPL